MEKPDLTIQLNSRAMHDLGWRINRSGRLRMVSHRLCMHLALGQRSRARDDLGDFRATFRALLDGSPQDGVGPLQGGQAWSLLKDSQAAVVVRTGRFLGWAEDLLNGEVGAGESLTSLCDLTSRDLLEALNQLVEAFQADLDSGSRGRRTQIVEVIDQIEELGSRLHVVSINSRVLSSRAGALGRTYRVVNDELQALGASTAAAARQLRRLQEW